jgi:hypothetical protein
MSDPKPNPTTVDDLLRLRDIRNLPLPDALIVIGLLIDHVADTGDQSANDRAIQFAEAIEICDLDATDAALLNYFCANAWAHRQHASYQAKGSACWRGSDLSTTFGADSDRT